MLCDNPADIAKTHLPTISLPLPTLMPGMVFGSYHELDDYVRTFAIMVHCGYRTTSSHRDKFGRECLKKTSDGCRWRIWASRIPGGCFEIKSYAGEHTCTGDDSASSPQISTQWIARRIIDRVAADKGYKPAQIVRDVHEQYAVTIKYGLAYSAQQAALVMISGGKELAYAELPRYAKMIEKTNPGSCARVQTDETTNRFARFFVSYASHTKGFQWCRPLIFLDAGFIKEDHGGQIFVASGIDANGQLLPLALSIAKSESEESWTWMLQLLRDQLSLHNSLPEEQLTIISDRAKGLINAVEAVLPGAHHGYCLRHLCSNLIRKFCGQTNPDDLASAFWEVATAKTEYDYSASVVRLNDLLPAAMDYLIDVGTGHWAVAHFKGQRFGHLTSNPAESINSWLLHARELPILRLLECARQHMAKWMFDRKLLAENIRDHHLAARPDHLIQIATDQARTFQIHPSCETVFEVLVQTKSFRVDLHNHSCSCKLYQEHDLPCAHACAAILHYGKFIGHKSSRPRDWAANYYKKDAYSRTYGLAIMPIPALENWDVNEGSDTGLVRPPIKVKKSGRRRTKRLPSQPGDVPVSQQKRIICSFCKNYSPPYHNRRSCPMIQRVQVEDERQAEQRRNEYPVLSPTTEAISVVPSSNDRLFAGINCRPRSQRQQLLSKAAVRGRIGVDWGTIISHQIVNEALCFWIQWDRVNENENNPTLQTAAELRQNGQAGWVARYSQLHQL